MATSRVDRSGERRVRLRRNQFDRASGAQHQHVDLLAWRLRDASFEHRQSRVGLALGELQAGFEPTATHGSRQRVRDGLDPIDVTLEQSDPCIQPVQNPEQRTVDVGWEEGASCCRRFSRIVETPLRHPHTGEGGRADQSERRTTDLGQHHRAFKCGFGTAQVATFKAQPTACTQRLDEGRMILQAEFRAACERLLGERLRFVQRPLHAHRPRESAADHDLVVDRTQRRQRARSPGRLARSDEVVKPATRMDLEERRNDHGAVIRRSWVDTGEQLECEPRVAPLRGEVSPRHRQSPPALVVQLTGLTSRPLEPGVAGRQRSRDHEGGSDRHHAVGVERRAAARHGRDQRAHGDRATSHEDGSDLGLQELVCAIDLPGRHEVRQRGREHPPALVPLGRTPMRIQRPVEADGPQLVAQHVAKQLVIAVRLVPGRDHEQRRRFKSPQEGCGVVVARDRCTRAGFKLVEHGGAQQESLHDLRLVRQHLFNEEVAHDSDAARELRQEGVGIGLAPQCDRRHLHARHPSVGAIGEYSHRLGGEIRAQRVDQAVDFVWPEPKLGLANLEAAAVGPQPMERERRVTPAAGHDARAGRQPFHHLRDQRSSVAGDVHVVEHEDGRLVRQPA